MTDIRKRGTPSALAVAQEGRRPPAKPLELALITFYFSEFVLYSPLRHDDASPDLRAFRSAAFAASGAFMAR
jgi:hypothetical protein